MTKIFVEEESILDKTHFKSIKDLKEYLILHHLDSNPENLLIEEAAEYRTGMSEKSKTELLNFVIEQLKQVKDFRLIENIMTMLEFSKQDDVTIAEAHKKIVMDRYEDIRKNPERLIDWDDVKTTLMD